MPTKLTRDMPYAAHYAFTAYYNDLIAHQSKLSKLPVDLLKRIWYNGYQTGATHIKDGSLII